MSKEQEKGNLFGELVQQRRLSKGLTLQEVAKAAFVDHATISRLEHGKSQVSLMNAVALSIALDIGAEELVEELQLQRSPSILQQPYISRAGRSVLTEKEVEAFANDQITRSKTELLARLLNLIVFNTTEPWHIIQYWDGEEIPEYTAEDYRKVLTRMGFIRFEVENPPNVTASTILGKYKQGGVVLPVDIKCFLETLRQDIPQEIDPHLDNILKRVEIGTRERIKFIDIVSIAEAIGELQLINMAWSAYAFDFKVRPQEYQNIRYLIETGLPGRNKIDEFMLDHFIQLCRWLEYLSRDETWLQLIRQELDLKKYP